MLTGGEHKMTDRTSDLMTALLCGQIRTKVADRMAELLMEADPFARLMTEKDALEARERILAAVETACATFLQKVSTRLKCSPATAFVVPTTLE